MEVTLGTRTGIIKKGNKRRIGVLHDSFFHIPLIESIKQLLHNKDIRELVLRKPKTAPDGYFTDIADGTNVKNHPTVVENDNALLIIIYYDDVEICNPLGKNAGIHSLGFFYYLLANIPPEYRSKLPAIRLLAVAKKKVYIEIWN